jgi:hypothetical protein
MDQLINNLNGPGAREFLYVPGSMILQQAVLQVINKIIQSQPSIEILVVTVEGSQIDSPNVSNFRMTQISQAFLDIFFTNKTPRILIIESCANLGQFTVSREIGRILIVSSPFKTVEDLTKTSLFLSGMGGNSLVSPLEVTIFLGKIGYQIISPEFIYQGTPVVINSSKISWLIEYLRMNHGKHVIYTSIDIENISGSLRLSGLSVITVTGEDRYQIRYDKIQTFNQSKTQVILISNLYAFTPLYNVTSFVMLDSSENIFNSYVIKLASSPTILPIIFLISDDENYVRMAKDINLVSLIFEILKFGEVKSDKLSAFEIPDLSINIFKDENGKTLRFKEIEF